MRKKSSSRKKLSKKQRIGISAAAGTLALLGIAGAFFFAQNKDSGKNEDSYTTVTVKEAEPLLFKGTVKAASTQDYFYDQTLGKISNIAVTDGQQVDENTVLLTYENPTVQEQADEQASSLDKLNLAVQSAQTNLNSASNRQYELTNTYNAAYNEYYAQPANTAEEKMKQEELKAKMDQAKEAMEAQKDAVLQAQQALDAANVDLSSANASIQKTASKVSTTVTSSTRGIAYVDQKGKSDPTTAVVTVVSPDTHVEATVSEYDFKRIQKDQDVTVKTSNGEKEVHGVVTQVDQMPQAAATAAASGQSSGGDTMANYTFDVQPDENLQYGYSVQVKLPLNELRIPKKAIVKEGDQSFVYILQPSKKVKKQAVTAEEQNGIFVVKDGLKAKDKIIADPDKKLKDGKEVAVN